MRCSIMQFFVREVELDRRIAGTEYALSKISEATSFFTLNFDKAQGAQ
jgi:hypothetical protein